MAEISTVARPYSRAVFEFAQAKNKLAEWSDMLEFLSAVVSDPQMQSLISNTSVKKDKLTTLMQEICESRLDEFGFNLIKVLMENRRLNLVPVIKSQFQTLQAEAEGTIEAELISAFETSDEQVSTIAAALEKRLGKKVSMSVQINKDLIGGAIVRAGNLVIDGSAQGRFTKLCNTISR